MNKKRVSILYATGTGGTKIVAKLLGELLSETCEREVINIDESRALDSAARCDFLVLCYPTYYLRAAPAMRKFVDGLGTFDSPKPAYVVTTCELYTENSIRDIALRLKKRGAIVSGSKVIRAPGSDVTCVFPHWAIPWLYRFQRSFPRKLRDIAAEVNALLGAPAIRESIPGPRWYTPFTQAIQILFLNRFDGMRYKMRALPERCSRCGACVKDCDKKAWTMGERAPKLNPELCDLCGRCFHRCPRKAIVMLKALKDNRRLDEPLFARLENEARGSLK